MPVCIECCSPVAGLFTNYGKGNICLTLCPKCGKFADKYVEYDNTIIFIDMLLHKPQVYRHLLYNKLEDASTRGNDIDPGANPDRRPNHRLLAGLARHPGLSWVLIKLCMLLVLFEVYIKWANMDSSRHPPSLQSPTQFALQYLYLCGISTAEFTLFQLLVGLACIFMMGKDFTIRRLDSILAGVIISSFGKMLHIIMVIWDYHGMEFSYLINVIVFTSNLEALSAIINAPYFKTALMMGAAVVGKYIFQCLIHHLDPSFPLSLY